MGLLYGLKNDSDRELYFINKLYICMLIAQSTYICIVFCIFHVNYAWLTIQQPKPLLPSILTKVVEEQGGCN